MRPKPNSLPRSPRMGSRLSRRGVPRPPYLLLFVIILVSIGIGVLHNRWRSQGKIDPALAPLRLSLMPLQSGASRIRSGIASGWQSLFRSHALQSENERLKRQIGTLQQENERLRADAAEVNRLRKALAFAPHLKKPWLAGEVIGLFPSSNFDTITVARGTLNGVHDAMVARTPTGLIGQVTEVSLNTCQIMLLTDPGSSISAIIVHGGKPISVAIVRGAGRGQPLSLIYIRRDAQIRPGDKVISSGYGGLVPAGIPIGIVTTVENDKNALTQSARATAAIPAPGSIHEVFFLL